jgi:hypothetical protein
MAKIDHRRAFMAMPRRVGHLRCPSSSSAPGAIGSYGTTRTRIAQDRSIFEPIGGGKIASNSEKRDDRRV